MPKTVEQYLAMGLDQKTAEYFAAGRRTIVSVDPNDDFTLTLDFDNGDRRILGVKPHLKPGTVFEPFMKLENFKRVYLDASHSVCWDIDPTVDSKEVWENLVDLCPDSCYMESVPVANHN